MTRASAISNGAAPGRHNGGGPDLGAYEFGDEMPHFGPR